QPDQRQLHAQVFADLVQQRPAALVQRARADHLEPQQVLHGRRQLQRLDVRLGQAEVVQVLGRDVDVIAGGVGGQVLPEVGELQGRRQLVGIAHQRRV